MPPGGHVDEDELPEQTAVRECKEETGLDVSIVQDSAVDLFEGCQHEGRMLSMPIAMMLENIPAYGDHPAHQHMDFVFLARPNDETQELKMEELEATELRWFTRSEIERLDDKTEIFGNVKHYLLKTL